MTGTNATGIYNASTATINITSGTITGKNEGIYNYAGGTVTVNRRRDKINNWRCYL